MLERSELRSLILCNFKIQRQSTTAVVDLENTAVDLEDQGNDLIACLNDLEVGGPLVRVILVPSEFNMNDFVCLKADLQASFDRLQTAMNTHYEKISNASKSLEKEKSSPNIYKQDGKTYFTTHIT